MNILAVGVPEVTSYLQQYGWHRRDVGRVAEVWIALPHQQQWPGRRGFDGTYEVLLPKIETAPDFETRLNMLIKDLERVEDRPAEEIRNEIARQFVDVTDLTVDYPQDDSVIPLNLGERMFLSAKRLVVASAAATIHRRGYFGRSVPRQARDQAGNVFVGHTKRGSYVVPIVSRARLAELPWQDEQPKLIETVEEAAFSRRATVTMARALSHLQDLVVDRRGPPSVGEVHDAVGDGVSFELCGAVESIVASQPAELFRVGFEWSSRLPTPDVRRSVDFPTESGPLLKQVRDGLRRDFADRQQVVYGVVVLLKSRAEGGRVDIDALVEGRKRSVRLQLDARHYEIARMCHKRQPVVVRGVLHLHEGRQATMDVESFEPDASLPTL